MALTEEQIRHIAKLARLKLSDDQVSKFAKQIDGVLKYMDVLNEVDTDGVVETSQVTGLKNVSREDIVKNQAFEENMPPFLKSSPFPIERRQINVPGVFE